MPARHRVLIVGGGFGGLACARALRRAAVDVTLVDKRNHHLFQPLLYQVATGALSPANIATPLRAILRRQRNCRVLLADVVGFDLAHQRVRLRDGELPYDTLVVAAGAGPSYFGHDEWQAFAPGLKTVEDATEIRKRILYAFEAAERESDATRRQEWLTFVIVGAGPTGVELAGALSEIAHHTLSYDFRNIDPAEARILIVEAAAQPLAMYPAHLTEKAQQALRRLKVTLLTANRVTDIQARQIVVQATDAPDTTPPTIIATRTVIWAAGIAASPLGKTLADALGAKTDRAGRLIVEPDLRATPGANVYVIGDLAAYLHQGDKPLPGLAPVAMQQGKFVARQIANQAVGCSTTGVFRYRDRGSLAVIGRYSAIALLGRRQLSGIVAWIVWIFIHLMEITQFRNRLLVLFQWGWTFFTRDRSARLITGLTPSDETPTAEPWAATL